ncbi:DUF6655 family protein [Alienimonas californiensis]|uniref:Uncharacterized protein n=1 Tax=Alienimonas californiensis TaxID=2527989 RepID=A0A517P5S5_9PLAN|nr:DUF6655 family protein [Alienimonas californiensis]QDT14724.1 hypothetical protein CA12_08020 [Alienimonas californiensis]
MLAPTSLRTDEGRVSPIHRPSRRPTRRIDPPVPAADRTVCRPRPRPAIRPVTPPRRLSRVASLRVAALLCAAAAAGGLSGCGKTITREATQQLLTADSIDRAVAQLDLSPFEGRSVYLDTELLEHKNLDAMGVGGQNYLIGSLRQQFMAAGAKLEEKAATAEFVVEARAGAVGSDAHEVVYGMPANNLLSSAATLVPNSPPLPAIPELSLAKKSQEHAATKLHLFAYHRERREIVWQSGEAAANSEASHTWLLGAGPFEKGQIYDGTRFAGERVSIVPKWLRRKERDGEFDPIASLDNYNETRVYGFDAPPPEPVPTTEPVSPTDDGVKLASAEKPADDADKQPAKPAQEDKAADKKPSAETAEKASPKEDQDEDQKTADADADPKPADPPAAT